MRRKYKDIRFSAKIVDFFTFFFVSGGAFVENRAIWSVYQTKLMSAGGNPMNESDGNVTKRCLFFG